MDLRALSRLALLAALSSGVASGCVRGAPRGRPAALARDSAEALRGAVRLARPGFPTQDDAIRSGVYRTPPAPGAPPPGARQAAPAPTASEPLADRFVVQIAAFRDSASARASAAEARRLHPELRARVESEGDLYRVVLAGWPDAHAAEDALARIRVTFPSAWVRSGAVP